MLSANSINAYMRPLRSLVIWLVDEGRLEGGKAVLGHADERRRDRLMGAAFRRQGHA